MPLSSVSALPAEFDDGAHRYAQNDRFRPSAPALYVCVKQWRCAHCTFDNEAASAHCQICGIARGV